MTAWTVGRWRWCWRCLEPSERFSSTGVIELTGKIMVVAIVLLLFIVVFVFCLHLYAKYFWYRRRQNPISAASATRRRRRLDFAAARPEIAVLRRGLEPSVLKTLPVIIYNPNDFKDGLLECAVCLSEISLGEKTRLLPKCNHGFHLDCIDMWFESHSTCPLCRNPVKGTNQSGPEHDSSNSETVVALIVEDSVFPTNVLIWGDETQVSTFGPCGGLEENSSHHIQDGGDVVEPSLSSSSMASTSGSPDGITTVDIPRQVNEEEDQKSAVPTRLRSLKRLLSYNNRRVNPTSPRDLDIEQGGRS